MVGVACRPAEGLGAALAQNLVYKVARTRQDQKQHCMSP